MTAAAWLLVGIGVLVAGAVLLLLALRQLARGGWSDDEGDDGPA